jgi:hypothetical protein
MAEYEKEAFKFPDENVVETNKDAKEKPEDKLEIVIEGEEAPVKVEIEDDTPPEDRNRKPMVEPPAEVTEEELLKYKDVKLRDRLAHLNKGYHEERRAKEAAIREREEALSIAQRILAENEQLKNSSQNNQKILLDQAKTVAAKELEEAKRKYKAAYESGDGDAVTAAQDELMTAKIKVERINNFRPKALQPAETRVEPAYVPQPPASGAVYRDEKAEAWKTRNGWFNKDREMTGFALAVHERLVEEEGLNPLSDTYYERIDARMREKFPEKFQDSGNGGNEKPRRGSVVSPATRSTAPNKIVLTPSAVNVAKRLGVPLELYAKKAAEGMRNR